MDFPVVTGWPPQIRIKCNVASPVVVVLAGNKNEPAYDAPEVALLVVVT